VRGSWDGWSEGYPGRRLLGKQVAYLNELQFSKSVACEYKYIVNGEWTTNSPKDLNANQNHHFQADTNLLKGLVYENLVELRRTFNGLSKLAAKEYPYIHMMHHGDGVISVQREHVSQTKSLLLVTRTAYAESQDSEVNLQVQCPGRLDEVLGIYFIGNEYALNQTDDKWLHGSKADVHQVFNIREFADFNFDQASGKTILRFYNLPPSTTIVLSCKLSELNSGNLL